MKNKQLRKLVELAIETSFQNGKLNESKVASVIKVFKKLPKAQAIFALSEYLKRLRMEINKTTLNIESAVAFSPTELKRVQNLFKKDFMVNKVETTVKPEILGGLKVKIGDNLFDYSIKTKIMQIGGLIRG